MSDLECPYCGTGQEVCHDDGFGYAEDRRHEQTCGECGKSYVFETWVSFHYTPSKADCLNGETHNLEPMSIYTTGTYPDAVRCKDCDFEDRGRHVPPSN